MKKIISCIITCCLICGLTACSSQEEKSPVLTVETEPPVFTEESESPAPSASEETEPSKEDVQTDIPKILIAYFSWADNTVVMDEEASVESVLKHYESVGDTGEYVDAISSASVVQPGNVEAMANWIQEYVGGDVFSITVSEPYPSIYDDCLDRVADEKADNARPELVNHVENMEDYDVIFLGFPNWWYTAPMAIFSFIEEYDLSGKTVVPFCSHGTGGLAGSVRDITKALPDSTEVLEPLGVYRGDIHTAQQTVNEWLDSIGFAEAAAEDTSNAESEVKTMRMTVDGQEVLVTLNDTPLANALYEMLPLELSFEDFNGTEKIAHLPEGQGLSTDGATAGHDPAVGDLCLYAPWGNLCIFYQDFRYSDELYSIGHIESGIEILSGIENDFTVTLKKENRSQNEGLEAVPPSKPIPKTDNSWQFDTPEKHNMDPQVFEALHSALPDSDILSVVTVKDGVIIDEYYARGYDENSLFEIHSASKSVTSALIGIAIEEGYIGGVDDLLSDYLPQVAMMTDGKQNLTLRHLLTHTSGIEWYEWGGGYSNWSEFRSAENWVDYILDQDMVAQPGAVFNYSTGNTHLLSAVLQTATGMTQEEYCREKLFDPIGIDEETYWITDPQGVGDGGNGLVISPRDAAKFGQLFLQGGLWNDRQLVPAKWVEESTSVQNAGPGGTGQYGFQWWIQPYTTGQYDTYITPYPSARYNTYFAFGYGGQFIYVVPKLDLVAVFTSGGHSSYGPRPYFTDYILNAYMG